MVTETSAFDPGSPGEVVRLEAGTEPVPGYRLEKLLGRGGFGEVWRAQGPGGVAVAMKFIRHDGKAGSLELRSLAMMKEIRHGNLLSLFGVWQRDPFLILALELADRSLLDRLHEAQAQGQPGIPFPELLEYLNDVARALDFLNEPRHTQDGKTGLSIQHRDIKPHNLLLVGDTVKLADFGLARLLERQVTSHTGAMTPAYAAPEFFKGQTTNQSDQYSLAITYCQLRGGRLPFSGTPEQMMMGHAQEEPDLSMLPEAERPIVRRALSKKPEERWPSCRAFVQALAATVRTSEPPPSQVTTLLPASSPRPAPAARAPRRRRWPWLVAAGVLLVVLPACGILALLFHWASQPIPLIAVPREATARHTHRETPPPPAKPPDITGVAFRPSGRVVSVGADGTVRSWDDPVVKPIGGINYALVGSVRHDHAATEPTWPGLGMVLSPDGLRFLTDTNRGVKLWDVETGNNLRFLDLAERVVIPNTYEVHSKAFSPDGRRFIVGYTRSTGGENIPECLVGTLDAKTIVLHRAQDTGPAVCVAISSDGKKALAANREGVHLWDAETAAAKPPLTKRGGVISMAFAPDGKQCLLGEDTDTVVLVDVETGQELRTFPGHSGGVSAVLFSPDGKRAVSGGWDKTVRLWDVENGKQLECWRGHEATVTSVAFSADGTRVASGSRDGRVWLWTVSNVPGK
jgi:WD40 repeat protein